MKPVLDSLKEFRALVVSLDSAPTGKLSKEIQTLKTSVVGVATELERALEGLPAAIEKQVGKAKGTGARAARDAGRAAGNAFNEGMAETTKPLKVRVAVPSVPMLGGSRVSMTGSSLSDLPELQSARTALLAQQSQLQRDLMVDTMRLAAPLANKSAQDSAKAFTDAFYATAMRAKTASPIDPRTLLGLAPNVLSKSAAASADVFKAQFATEVSRARAASPVDVRTILGLTPNVMGKSAAASAEVFKEQFRVEALRAKSATPVDARTLLGLTPEATGRSARASASVFMAAMAGDTGVFQGRAAAREMEDFVRSGARASASQRDLNEAMRAGHSAARGLASGFNAMWLTWGQLGPILAGAALSNTFVSAIRTGAEFEQRLAAIRYLGQESAGSVNELAKASLDLARTGPFGPVEIANALKTLSLAGLSAKEQLAALKPTLNFSIAGEVPLEKAAESLVAISTAFGYSAQGFGTVGDVIAKAAAVSMSSVESMTESFKQASTVAQQYGVSVQDAATSLALLSQVGIRGTAAGTAMRNMYNELLGTSREARRVLNETFGVKVFDNTTKAVRPLVDIMSDLSASLKGMNFESQQRALQALGNERGLKALSANLMAFNQEAKEVGKDLPSRLAEVRKQLEEAPGFAAQAAVGMGLTTQNQIKGTFSSLQAALVEAYGQINPVVQAMAADLRALFNSTEFRQAIQGLISGMAGFTRVLMDNGQVIAAVASGYLIGKAALIAYSVIQPAAAAGAAALASALAGTAAASGAAALGLRGLLIAAGPLGALVAAAGAAYVLFSQTSKNAMTEASFAVDAHYKATVEGLDNELDRLAKERKAIQDNLDGKVAAHAVEAALGVDRLKQLNAEERAQARLLLQQKMRWTFLEEERVQGDTSARADGIRRNMSAQRDSYYMEFAGGELARQARVSELEEKSRQVRNAAMENARLAAEQARRNRPVPAGDGTYNPDDRARGSGARALRDTRGELENLFKVTQVAEQASGRRAQEELREQEHRYNLGLQAAEAFETSRDEINRRHFEERMALLRLEEQEAVRIKDKFEAQAGAANAKKAGSVSADALKNELDAAEARLLASRESIDKLQADQRDAERKSLERRSKPLVDQLKDLDKFLAQENQSLDAARARADVLVANSVISERQAAVNEASLAKYLELKKQEEELERLIALHIAAKGDPRVLEQAQRRLDELRNSTPDKQRKAGEAAGGIFDKEQISRSTLELRKSLAEAIMEGGEDGGKRLGDILQNALLRRPLTLFLEAAMSPVAGMLSSVGQSFGNSLLSVFGMRAGGGPMTRGNDYLVGEMGPEIVRMGDNGHAYSASDTRRMAATGASGTTLHLTSAPVITIDSRSDQAQIYSIVRQSNEASNKALVEELRNAGVIT